jgi:queuine tRNA-ribosyltransferase
MFAFTLEKTVGNARAGRMQTAHGEALTPMFMPVGTQATVKALDTQDVLGARPQVILANTYHLYLRPGAELISRFGGVHGFMGYDKPLLTDSGGFQVFSLGEQMERKGPTDLPRTKISENGVEFFSYLDGSKHFFTPEKSIEIQRHLGADIIMAFDECLPDAADEPTARASVDRTHRWAQRCVTWWAEHDRQSVDLSTPGATGHYQALFGIIQGSQHRHLRELAAQQILSLPFDGIALGGETIGYNMPKTVEIMDWLRDVLPTDKPRYAMGLGRDPQNVIDAVQAGYDMFDCVAPTRLARNGALYFGRLNTTKSTWTWDSPYNKGRLQIGNHEFAEDHAPIQLDCDCYTCQQGYSRAYLHHLYRTQELTYYRLASIHNVRTMVRLTEELRQVILAE